MVKRHWDCPEELFKRSADSSIFRKNQVNYGLGTEVPYFLIDILVSIEICTGCD